MAGRCTKASAKSGIRAYRRDHASVVGGQATLGDEGAERPWRPMGMVRKVRGLKVIKMIVLPAWTRNEKQK